MVAEDEERKALQDIINNVKLSEGYLILARDIEVMETKTYMRPVLKILFPFLLYC